MKKILRNSKVMIAAAACFALLSQTPRTTLADRGGGSIRAAARPAPPPRAPAPPPRAPTPPPRAPDVHNDAHPDDHPQPRPDDHPQARPDVHPQPPARPDWDDHDEDARHFGGFSPGSIVRAIRGQRVHDLPPNHFAIVFNNQNYYWDDTGAYYVQQPDGEYLIVQPPVGAIVPSLPSGVTTIQVGPTVFYYLDGVFYVAQDNSFAVVNPPPGIVVPDVPPEATMYVNNGIVSYQYNGLNYQPSIQDGVTVYTVNPQ